jgi:hypothetical protein
MIRALCNSKTKNTLKGYSTDSAYSAYDPFRNTSMGKLK